MPTRPQILVPWVLAQWEEYHTGVMMYGTRLYGVLEANYSICAVHLVSWAFGASIWAAELPLPGFAGGGTATLADVCLMVVGAAGIVQAAHNVYRVLGPSPVPLPPAEVGNKQLGRGVAARQLLGLGAVLALGAVLLHQAKGTSALHSRLSFSVFGVVYALMATQLIIAHMCKEPLAPPWLAIGLLGVAACGGMLTVGHARVLIMVVSVAAAGVYSVYIVSIIDQICDFLGIRVLSITPPAASEASKKQ